MNIKRLFSVLFIMFASLSVLFACTSDNPADGQSSCTHVPGEKTTENAVAASCTKDGSYDEVTSCILCGIEISRSKEPLPALGHDMGDYTSNKNATCTVDGTKTRICNNGCGYEETVTDVGSAKGHLGTKLVSSNNETCNDKPLGKLYCADCNELLGEYGHKYEKTITQPTCYKSGKTTYTCIECQDSYSTSIPSLGHMVSGWTTTLEPTCHDEGTSSKICLVCEITIEEKKLSKLEHSFTSTRLNDSIVYQCRECSHSYSETVTQTLHGIVFEVNEGTPIPDMTVVYGTIPELPIISRSGYIFQGWYTDSSFDNPYSNGPITENITLYAKWE